MKVIRLQVLILIMTAIGAFDACASSNLHFHKIRSKALSGSLLGLDPNREIQVYTPPTYDNTTLPFPVLYYLTGFTSPVFELADGVYNGFDMPGFLDAYFAEKPESSFIVVFCSGVNELGGGFYTNSPLTGKWEDFSTQELVEYIDHHYRTRPKPEARIFSGHSMGGTGALNIALAHPQIFGKCIALSPGVFDEDGLLEFGIVGTEEQITLLHKVEQRIQKEVQFEMSATNSAAIKKFADYHLNKSTEDYYLIFTLAYASAFTRENELSDSFPFVSIPKKPVTNYEEIETRYWFRDFGLWDEKISAFKHLGLPAQFIIDVGRKDTWIYSESTYLYELMQMEGLQTEIHVHQGGHHDLLGTRIAKTHTPKKASYFTSNIGLR